MIENREAYIKGVAEIPIWDRALSIRVLTLNERTSCASVEVSLDDDRFHEEDFLGCRYSPDHQSLMPVVELALISESNHRLAILMGLRKWVALFPDGSPGKTDIPLNRDDKEDSGFYACLLLETDHGVIGIYESGIVKIGWDGLVQWHKKKFWDDTFGGVQDHLMKFVNDSSSTEYYLDLHTGNEAR